MEESRNSVGRFECQGWWEQRVYGRQPMTALQVEFKDKQLIGRGNDVIGAFTLNGTVHESGQVVIAKQYNGHHNVLYVGTYDGEGTFAGHWQIGGDRGRWLISLCRTGEQSTAEITEIAPGTHVNAASSSKH